MNLGNIVTPNSKGQIVIPIGLRNSLGITHQTPLQIIQSGQSLVLHPVVGVIRKADSNEAFKKILDQTRGSWAGDDWEKTEKRRRRIELDATKRNRQAW